MKVAIAVYGTRVSPLFDTAGRLLVVEPDSRQDGECETLTLTGYSAAARVAELTSRGIEALVCGGISRPLADMVKDSGIRLVPWVAGEVDEVLAAFKSGRLSDPRFLMPGCGRRCRQPRRGGRGPGASGWQGREIQPFRGWI